MNVKLTIRQRLNDIGMVNVDVNCGHNGIEGRNDDHIILKDVRRIGRLDSAVFKGDMPIIEEKVIQEKLDQFIIKWFLRVNGTLILKRPYVSIFVSSWDK